MPYSVTQDHSDCDGYAVVKDDGGRLMGCHTSERAAQDQITALNISEAEKHLLAIGATKATSEEIDERYSAFREAVNMSASEIESWGDTDCANEASENPQAVRDRVVRLLRTDKDDWGDDEYEAAGRVTSFIARMRGMEQGETSGDCPSERDISLMNWGYDPTKSIRSRPRKMQHDYEKGDVVTWDSSGGMASGQILRVVTSGSVSPSTTDREYEASEDDPRYLIQLMDDEGELRSEDGEPQTVVHTGEALAMKSRAYMIGDTMVYSGSTVKDLSDTGRFGGWLIKFGSPDATDVEGDFFTKQSDFWLHNGKGSTHVLYGHGMDPELKRRRLTTEPARIVTKDAGVWMEGQMQVRDEYEEAIMEMMRMGKLGASSGTAAHLVESEQVKGAQWLKTWPLGLDGSLTPQPAEPRMRMHPLKNTRIPTVKSLISRLHGEADELDTLLARVKEANARAAREHHDAAIDTLIDSLQR